MVAKIFQFVKRNIWLLVIGVLSISFAFSLGIIVGGKIISRPAMIIEKELLAAFEETAQQTLLNDKENKQAGFVASSRGKYYYPIVCDLAQNLSEKNKIYFQTREEAETNGYIYNSRCP